MGRVTPTLDMDALARDDEVGPKGLEGDDLLVLRGDLLTRVPAGRGGV
jgi:hypothetical protein